MSTDTERPTSAGVTRLVGVSQQVVSCVLRGDRGTPIARDTRRRVLASIEQVGYVPHRAARSLYTRNRLTFAGRILDIKNPFHPAFERGVRDIVDAHGHESIVYNTAGDAAAEARCLRSRLGVDGIAGDFFHLIARERRSLPERGVAIVRHEISIKDVGTLPPDTIYIDTTPAARRAVTYLIDRGHRRIAMVASHSGPGNPRADRSRRALTDRDSAIDPSLIRETSSDDAGGDEATRELLRDAPDLTAILASHEVPAARLIPSPLTPIARFLRRLDRRAAALFLDRLTGRLSGPGHTEEMLPSLIIRHSS